MSGMGGGIVDKDEDDSGLSGTVKILYRELSAY